MHGSTDIKQTVHAIKCNKNIIYIFCSIIFLSLLITMLLKYTYHIALWNRNTIVYYMWCFKSKVLEHTIKNITKLYTRMFHIECCMLCTIVVEASWNVMAHAQKPDFVFRRNGRVHLNRQGRQFSQLLAAKICTSAVVMLDTPCSEVVWRLLSTHSIRQFPLHFPSCASPCAITF
jgi:hypothetical protein